MAVLADLKVVMMATVGVEAKVEGMVALGETEARFAVAVVLVLAAAVAAALVGMVGWEATAAAVVCWVVRAPMAVLADLKVVPMATVGVEANVEGMVALGETE